MPAESSFRRMRPLSSFRRIPAVSSFQRMPAVSTFRRMSAVSSFRRMPAVSLLRRMSSVSLFRQLWSIAQCAWSNKRCWRYCVPISHNLNWNWMPLLWLYYKRWPWCFLPHVLIIPFAHACSQQSLRLAGLRVRVPQLAGRRQLCLPRRKEARQWFPQLHR